MQNTITYPSPTQWITPRTVDGSNITQNNCALILSRKIAKLAKVLLKADNGVKIHTENNGGGKLSDYAPTSIARAILLDYIEMARVRNFMKDTSGNYVKDLDTLSYTELYWSYWNAVNAKYAPTGGVISDEDYDKYILSYVNEVKSNAITELDLTPYIVEYAKYQTLRTANAVTTDELLKINTSYYTMYNNVIHLVDTTFGNVFKKSVFSQMVQSAAYRQYQDVVSLLVGDLSLSSTKIVADAAVRFVVDVRDCQFRVIYTPLGETTKIDIPKLNPQPRQFSIPYNQQQTIISNIGQGRQAQLTANMMGVAKREIVRNIDTPLDRRPLYTTCRMGKDEWVLIAHEMSVANARTLDKETWSKNWTAQSQFVGVNRQYRTWNTPADIVERGLTHSEYLFVTSDLDFSLVAKRTPRLITEEALALLVKSLTYQTSDIPTECNLMWITTQPVHGLNIALGVVVNCSSFGFGNTLVFAGRTEDNLAGGKQRESVDSDTFCPDVYYCNEDGTAEYMQFACASEVAYFDADKWPQAEITSSDKLGLNTCVLGDENPNGVVLFNTGYLQIDKDPAEQINFTYLLSFLTDEPDIIIGTGWANSNALVKNLTAEGRSVKLWALDKPLPRSAQVCASSFGTATVVTAENAESAKRYFDVEQVNGEWRLKFNPPNNSHGLCITDMNNNILVAYNGATPKTYKVVVCTDYEILWRSLHPQA